MVTLVPMSQEDFERYREKALPNLANEIARSRDLTEAEGMRHALASFQSLFPNDKIGSRDVEIYHVVTDGDRVGAAIFGVRRDKRVPYAYVWDIQVFPKFRGRGFGEAAMRAMEARARELKLKSIALNVFGQNAPARALYEKLGFEAESLILKKSL